MLIGAIAWGALGCMAGKASGQAEPGTAASTDEETLRRARRQFEEALARLTAGDCVGALVLLNEVAAVKMTPQVRFNIGWCEESLGRLNAALGEYEQAALEAKEKGVSDVAAEAQKGVTAVQARLPKVVITRGAGAEYATVLLDGVILGEKALGADLPLDPGPHVIDATAADRKAFHAVFNIAGGERKVVSVTLAAR
ncbi:MAG TPA: hypothetical protein VF316_21475 [Polyangiaceae bacterium]